MFVACASVWHVCPTACTYTCVAWCSVVAALMAISSAMKSPMTLYEARGSLTVRVAMVRAPHSRWAHV